MVRFIAENRGISAVDVSLTGAGNLLRAPGLQTATLIVQSRGWRVQTVTLTALQRGTLAPARSPPSAGPSVSRRYRGW